MLPNGKRQQAVKEIRALCEGPPPPLSSGVDLAARTLSNGRLYNPARSSRSALSPRDRVLRCSFWKRNPDCPP